MKNLEKELSELKLNMSENWNAKALLDYLGYEPAGEMEQGRTKYINKRESPLPQPIDDNIKNNFTIVVLDEGRNAISHRMNGEPPILYPIGSFVDRILRDTYIRQTNLEDRKQNEVDTFAVNNMKILTAWVDKLPGFGGKEIPTEVKSQETDMDPEKAEFVKYWNNIVNVPALTFPNGDYMYVEYDETSDKLKAGHVTNAGLHPQHEVEVDYSRSIDFNIEGLYYKALEENPELGLSLDEEEELSSQQKMG